MKQAAYLAAQVIKSHWPNVNQKQVFDIVLAAMQFNPVSAFLSERCAIINKKQYIESKVLFAEYEKWCREYHIEPLKKHAFYEGLRNAGIKSKRWGTGLVWRGLAIIPKRDKM